jgi:putative nucleotidyltransferase with HDIG domain
MHALGRSAATYVGATIAAGLCVLVVAFPRVGAAWPQVLVLAALFWIGDSSPVQMRLNRLSISTGFPVAVAAVLLLGPWRAAVVCAASAFAGSHRAAWVKRGFNGAQMILSALLSGLAFEHAPGGVPGDFSHAAFPQVLPAVGIASAVYLFANYSLVAGAICLTTGTRLTSVWAGGMSETLIPSLGYGLLGLVIAVLWTGGVGPVAALLVLAPMLIARWAFQQYGEQHKAYEATVASLIRAVETKDYYTRGHSERVAKASVMLAEQLGMREDRLEMLRYAGMLHDVGKLGVPTKLLQKTGPLDEGEFATIKQHPSRGFEMVEGISFLDEAMLGIKHHHERVDGRGYPEGLAGDAIPEFARIIAVADAFDSMTSTRSYRSARTVESAIRELRQWTGTQFDAVMVDALVVAVEAHGWEVNVGLGEVMDPAALTLRDHDDPTAEVLVAAFGYHAPQLQAEVS